MRQQLLCAAVIAAFAGCSTRQSLENEGALCAMSQVRDDTIVATSWQEPQTFAADAPVYLRYFSTHCLSSSCDTDRESGCTVQLEGNVLRVESHLEWTRGPGPACTDDCGIMTAVCQSPPLPAGTYTVRHGAQEMVLTVPSESAQAPCTARPL